jgi:K+-sensing histidine kinase KdpD
MDQKAFLQEFIASVSHEFRTPLASLTASLEIFWDEADHLSRQEIRDLLKSLQLSVTNLQMLVDNLLDSASLQAEQLILKSQPIALNKLIASAVYIIQPLLDRRSQTLGYHAPLYLPTVNADAPRIRQVLLNLLVNASKYSPQGSHIGIRATAEGQTGIRISVTDRGRGIPLGQEESIFQRFTRFDDEQSDERGGLGMGLALVKAIIEAHGGQVGATSREGGGTVVWFTLGDTP